MIILYLILIVYIIHILELILGLKKSEVVEFKTKSKYTFSVLIPFNDEKEHLPKLIDSLNQLNYPKELFEVIFIDDSPEKELIIQRADFDFRVISNERKSNSPKKDALTIGVKNAKYDWIVTTDSDCLFPENWLTVFNEYASSFRMLIGSVLYKKEEGFLKLFQYYDFLVLQGITAATFQNKNPFMCNGANFAFEKELFFELKGYEGNYHISSGDDVFMLQKALKYCRNEIFYLENKNTVITFAVNSWEKLFLQRARWGKKSVAYQNNYPKVLGVFAVLSNLFFYPILFYYFKEPIGLAFIGLKILIDEVFLDISSKKLRQKKGLTLGFSFFYPIFIIVVIYKIFFSKIKWK